MCSKEEIFTCFNPPSILKEVPDKRENLSNLFKIYNSINNLMHFLKKDFSKIYNSVSKLIYKNLKILYFTLQEVVKVQDCIIGDGPYIGNVTFLKKNLQ